MRRLNFNLSLSTMGLCVIVLPLLFQIVFVWYLFKLHNEAERDAAVAVHASKLGYLINSVEHDGITIATSLHGDRLFDADFNDPQYESAIRDLYVIYDELDLETKDNAEKNVLVHNAHDSMMRALKVLEQAKKDYYSGKMPPKSDARRGFFRQMRSLLAQVFSADLVSVGDWAKEVAEKNPIRQAQYRQQLRFLLAACIVISVLLTFALAIGFRMFFIGRLKRIVDNSVLLASEQPLKPPLSGSDEIANLDRSFHEMAEALKVAARKERAIIDNARDVLTTLDSKGTFLAVNPASEKVLGYLPSELIGSRLVSYVAPEDTELVLTHMKEVMTGSSEPFETRLVRKDRHIIEVEWSAVWNDVERTMFCVVHDITERKQAERMRQEVLGMVSHDLKNPLATVRSFLEMLEEGIFGKLDERGERLLKLADNSSARMLRLIQDLLDIQKMESGMLELHKEQTKVSTLFEQALHAVVTQAASAGVLTEAKPTTLEIYADSDRIMQVLINLLGNAIKFSKPLAMVRLTAEQVPGYVVLKVSDEGRGIPPNMREAVFDRFKQVQADDAKQQGGSGLGLAICKALIELHGGHIKLESEVNKGSTFSLFIPAEERAQLSDVPVPSVVAKDASVSTSA